MIKGVERQLPNVAEMNTDFPRIEINAFRDTGEGEEKRNIQ